MIQKRYAWSTSGMQEHDNGAYMLHDTHYRDEVLSLRATIEQQEQELERVKESNRERIAKEIELRDQLAAMRTERDAAVTLYSLEAEKERKLSSEFGKQNFELTVTRQQLAKAQARLAEQDRWLQNGVYFTNKEFQQHIAEHKAALTARVQELEAQEAEYKRRGL